jgi:hypothetical protein
MPLDHHIKRAKERKKEIEKFRDDLEARVRQPPQEPKPPPEPVPLTERQSEQLKAEQEAGRKRTEYFEEQAANRPPPPPPDPSEGTMTPVFRPKNYTHETKKGGK